VDFAIVPDLNWRKLNCRRFGRRSFDSRFDASFLKGRMPTFGVCLRLFDAPRFYWVVVSSPLRDKALDHLPIRGATIRDTCGGFRRPVLTGLC
jgi:hypothetical protein